MKQLSNIHTHCTFCDGADTPREMIEAAIAMGHTDLGISSHSPAPFDPTCPGIHSEAEYRQEIHALREEYKDRINILCGIEQDIDTSIDKDAYDYVIGAAHYVLLPGPRYVAVDGEVQEIQAAIKEHYGGSGLAMAQDYYARFARGLKAIKPTVIGHFDLVTKYNTRGELFDEESGAYQNAALAALDEALTLVAGYGGLLEINTGAMARGSRDIPYPALFLLRHAAQKKARVIITTDCHEKAKLGYGYDDALALLRTAGFTQMAVLQNGVFVDVAI